MVVEFDVVVFRIYFVLGWPVQPGITLISYP